MNPQAPNKPAWYHDVDPQTLDRIWEENESKASSTETTVNVETKNDANSATKTN